jgi:uncharacterized protein with GYD domain
MATYISLIDYTQKGLDAIKDSPQRAAAFRESAGRAGITVKELYWTTGGHDGVLIMEGPDEKAIMALLLTLSRAGNVRTKTLRAFAQPEMKEILDSTL